MQNPIQLFKCLSDDTRLNALLLLRAEGELCVCELVEAMDESQPKISRHLAQLRNCGLVHDERKGQWVFYSLSSDLPPWALSIIQAASSARQTELNQFQSALHIMASRPDCR
jgi:ArsR family transcriptional regulator